MKLPRFRLQKLFIAIALLSIPMGCVAYQLNWIRQRHGFGRTHQIMAATTYETTTVKAPWSLRIFGESAAPMLMNVPEELVPEARALFPEAIVNPGPSYFPPITDAPFVR